MYIYHALINALSTRMILIKINTLVYTYVEHSPTETIYIRCYMETYARMQAHTHTQ